MREPVGENALDQAAKRLDRALAQLEQRLKAGASSSAGELFDQDAAKLAAELDQARLREKALEEAGEEASLALGQAIAEIKAALQAAPGLEAALQDAKEA